MSNPYRWGDVAPPAVQKIKARREYRASSLYQTIKRGRRQRIEETAVLLTSAGQKPWDTEPQSSIDEAVTVYDASTGAVSVLPDVKRNWHGDVVSPCSSNLVGLASAGSRSSSLPRAAD